MLAPCRFTLGVTPLGASKIVRWCRAGRAITYTFHSIYKPICPCLFFIIVVTALLQIDKHELFWSMSLVVLDCHRSRALELAHLNTILWYFLFVGTGCGRSSDYNRARPLAYTDFFYIFSTVGVMSLLGDGGIPPIFDSRDEPGQHGKSSHN